MKTLLLFSNSLDYFQSFFAFIFLMTIILGKFIPKDRINLIGDFFKKVLPTFPISKIVEIIVKVKKGNN